MSSPEAARYPAVQGARPTTSSECLHRSARPSIALDRLLGEDREDRGSRVLVYQRVAVVCTHVSPQEAGEQVLGPRIAVEVRHRLTIVPLSVECGVVLSPPSPGSPQGHPIRG